MTDRPHVVAVCGSLREASRTRLALSHALDGVREAGGSGELIDLREFELPMYDPDVDDQADGRELRARLRAADAVILGTPMYHGSYSNVVKNALDYCGFDEFEGKTVGLLAVAGGSFPVTALEHLRSVCRALDAWVVPHQVAVPRASGAISEDGTFDDEDLAERVRVLGRRVVQYADIEPDPASFESEHNAGA
ncbi:NADPH-dependent FMN reductase [Halobellus limi]|uniref:NAD(P)H-dependent FMN reductase n=1 Tax=Halobellus limi TaxID=699433 RepID=A0A1H5UBM6_9EURY|nr:NAD(P)H-dependent oxidoreductase [Halobellus limi]QCC47085.1 NADPH-dependent oxidoreductase [Halobellus limi]SEF72440.1 NAD(P)H-dependent FMN reductase [Halobellus limi]